VVAHPINMPADGECEMVHASCEAAQLLAQHAGEHGDHAVHQVDGRPPVLRRLVQRRAQPVLQSDACHPQEVGWLSMSMSGWEQSGTGRM